MDRHVALVRDWQRNLAMMHGWERNADGTSYLRILVTGSRVWRAAEVVADALDFALTVYEVPGRLPILVHGGAKGADRWADGIWRYWIQTGHNLHLPEVHRPDWERYGKSAAFIRNERMVDLGATICLAFALDWASGTGHCARYARKMGIPVLDYGTTTAA